MKTHLILSRDRFYWELWAMTVPWPGYYYFMSLRLLVGNEAACSEACSCGMERTLTLQKTWGECKNGKISHLLCQQSTVFWEGFGNLSIRYKCLFCSDFLRVKLIWGKNIIFPRFLLFLLCGFSESLFLQSVIWKLVFMLSGSKQTGVFILSLNNKIRTVFTGCVKKFNFEFSNCQKQSRSSRV